MEMRFIRKGGEWRCLWKNEDFMSLKSENEGRTEKEVTYQKSMESILGKLPENTEGQASWRWVSGRCRGAPRGHCWRAQVLRRHPMPASSVLGYYTEVFSTVIHFKFIFKKIYLFIGCGVLSLLHMGFLYLQQARPIFHWHARASHCSGFSCCGARILSPTR